MSVQVPAAVAITGIACVYITVSDVYASTQWYVKNLGMEVSHYTPLVPEMGYAMLTCPSPGWSVFLLGSGVICPPAFRRRDGEEPLNCCFYVTDSQALLDRLKAHGVRLETEELFEWGGCDTNLRCYDPDGNKLEFCQPQS